ncbi:hypothetical protein BGZ70_007336 [Mortierella alpina]|uniref:RNI-like protein n=1 Tax=Mortierella alpina TaxID=64518 RepID=A0A9P6J9F0_MORAP|nr:hypothetical protein BGZ70_007336 [Mortierella alpina]
MTLDTAVDRSQAFRVVGTAQVLKIPIQHVNGQNVVYWESIEQVFPGFRCVKKADVAVPPCIPSFPGVILDVVLSSASENAPTDSFVRKPSLAPTATLTTAPDVGQNNALAGAQTDPSNEDKFIEDLQVTPGVAETPNRNIITNGPLARPSVASTSSSPQVETTSKIVLSFIDSLKRASEKAKNSDGPLCRKEFNAVMSRMLKLQESSDTKQREMVELQRASNAKQNEILRLQDEMKQLALVHHEETTQMQQRALDQMAVLQSRVQAVLTQTYELHEYPIPRLFIVLPQYPSGWDLLKPFTEKYRLYFLCECGEHTKTASSSKSRTPHEIHLAKHEGYEVTRPTAFFRQYGPYILTILKMLKYSLSVASVAVPAVAHLVNADALNHTAKSLEHLQKCIGPGMDQVIGRIEKDAVDELEPIKHFSDQVENKEALEGADLRKLETFLKDKDGYKVLGNLYRTVTDEGHVKWVCMDHFRENYNQTAAEVFQRAVTALGGSFDENNGLVQVKIGSRESANELYLALEKARSVYELDITLNWACTGTDVQALESALKKSVVAVLHLDLRQFQPSLTNKFSPIPTRYEVLSRILQPLNMKSVHIVLPRSLIKLSNFSPKRPPHLRKLSFEMVVGSNFRVHAETLETESTRTTLYRLGSSVGLNGAEALSKALKTNSTLTTLDFSSITIGDNGAQALSEALKTNSTLTTLDLKDNSIGDSGTQALAEALKTNATLTSLNLEDNSFGPDGVRALAEALTTNSTLITLSLQGNLINVFTSSGTMALAEALKTNSTLTTLNLQHNSIGRRGTQALAEALKTNTTLTTLNLQRNMIGSSDTQALAEALKTNSTLTTLNLQRNLVGDTGAQALAKALRTNSALSTLYLGINQIENYGAKALAGALQTNSTLTTLYLTDNKIEDGGAKALADALKANSTLTTLDLRENSIGSDGAMALAEVLQTNLALTTLILDNNFIGSYGAMALAKALKTNSTVTTLDLGHNSIGVTEARAFSEVLMINSTLTTLDLGYSTAFGSEGAQVLSEALDVNSTLTTLQLWGSMIGDNGAKALSKALTSNSTLSTLHLSNNSIGFNGAHALSELLKINSTLTTLNLSRNNIDDDGAKALADTLKTNSTLTTLYLRDNSIGSDGAKALAESLKSNSTVTIYGVPGLAKT